MWVARSRRELVPPKVLESVGRHFGVPDRVLNVLVPEVVLEGPRVVAIIGQLEPAGMAKHVGVDREWHLGSLTEALDKPVGSWSHRDARSGHACGRSPSAARSRVG